MVIDTSAVVAILKAEPEARALLTKLAGAAVCRLSAASFVEAGLVIRHDVTGTYAQALETLIKEFNIQIEPVTERQARIALDAYNRFGRGTGHRASLNYGDCFSYALTKDTGESLLFKGNDFSQTDITLAV
jgi:ribonuclease VapC